SSPGRLAMLGIGLVAAVLLAGVVAAVEADFQDERWNDLRRHSEPMSAAASHLYSSLSIADATRRPPSCPAGSPPNGCAPDISRRWPTPRPRWSLARSARRATTGT